MYDNPSVVAALVFIVVEEVGSSVARRIHDLILSLSRPLQIDIALFHALSVACCAFRARTIVLPALRMLQLWPTPPPPPLFPPATPRSLFTLYVSFPLRLLPFFFPLFCLLACFSLVLHCFLIFFQFSSSPFLPLLDFHAIVSWSTSLLCVLSCRSPAVPLPLFLWFFVSFLFRSRFPPIDVALP